MIEMIYIEKALSNHPKVQEIKARFKEATCVDCHRYGEVFNRKNQNFRIQKQKPSLILAEKLTQHVLPIPAAYSLGKAHNFYFSHILNCLYDCRYCFLQGMYKSAHYVFFVNYEDFQTAILEKIKNHPHGATFFSGYDGDSLALNPLTKFIEHFIPFFEAFPQHELELRTKSNAIHPLLNLAPQKNVIIAYSLSPPWVVERFEHRTARAHQRIKALQKLQEKGWPIGLRFDPLIFHPDWKMHYEDFFNEVFHQLDPQKIHSVTLGPFRMPLKMAQSLQQQFPDEPLFFHGLDRKEKHLTYQKEIEKELLGFCKDKILSFVSEEQFFPCYEEVL